MKHATCWIVWYPERVGGVQLDASHLPCSFV